MGYEPPLDDPTAIGKDEEDEFLEDEGRPGEMYDDHFND